LIITILPLDDEILRPRSVAVFFRAGKGAAELKGVDERSASMSGDSRCIIFAASTRFWLSPASAVPRSAAARVEGRTTTRESFGRMRA